MTPARAFALGTVWFFVASLGFASAMPHLVSAYFDAPWIAGVGALLALTLVFGPLYGIWAGWLAWLVRRGAANPLLAAAGLGLVEYARTSAGSIFGWALLAHAPPPGAWILQSADLGGAYLPGMILTSTAYVVASVFAPPLRGPRGMRWAVGVTTITLLALGYGVRQDPTAGPESGIRVAIVQGGIPHDERWLPERRAADLEHYRELTARADEPDLIVWPEFAISFDLRRRSAERTALFAIAADHPELLLGAPFHRGLYPLILQNSAFLLREGTIAGRYDKTELLPFAERNPWPERISLGRAQYTPGRRLQPIAARQAELGVFLCSEALRPGVARELTRQGATLLANLANDSWLGRESAAAIQLRSTALRAIENRRFVLRGTGSGLSAIVDPTGRIVEVAPYGASDVLSGIVEPRTTRTLYSDLGDLGMGLAGIVAALGSFLALRRRAPHAAVQD